MWHMGHLPRTFQYDAFEKEQKSSIFGFCICASGATAGAATTGAAAAGAGGTGTQSPDSA